MKRIAPSSLSLALLALLGQVSQAQTSFDNDRLLAGFAAPAGILTENDPAPPIVAIPAAALGLNQLDEIDALSYGDDTAIANLHALVFSPAVESLGVPGSGVEQERLVDTAPGVPPAAAGDLFLQDVVLSPGNLLAPPGIGYDAGTTSGDEANAGWTTPCVSGGPCLDLDAFDTRDPFTAQGVYFSLRVGSPTLALIPASPGDILYSDLSGALPIVATLEGAGPATALNLGIPGRDLDALNVVGSVGPVDPRGPRGPGGAGSSGGGVISAGSVGPSVAGVFVGPSTHLLQYSVTADAGMGADVLVRTSFSSAAPHTPSLAIGLLGGDDVNALEVVPGSSGCPPELATAFAYNGTGVNRDVLSTTPVIVGSPWSATLSPQPGRGPGAWTLLLRTAQASGPILDLGQLFGLPAAGSSELLVGGGVITHFSPNPHGGAGSNAPFSVLVPMNCGLVGSPWHAQAIVLGDLPAGAGFFDPWLSTAMGGVIGTF